MLVKHELTLKPRLAVLETNMDPDKHEGLEVDADNQVICYPCFDDFEWIGLKVLRFDMTNDCMRIRKAERVA